ncbi:MAG: FAD-binding protein [Candidatus Kariarchaeaceae archaeon]
MAEATSKPSTHSSSNNGLNIGILIKQVPVPKEMRTGADGLMDRSGKSQMNPHCSHALEEALALREKTGGTITVFSMGPPNFTQSLDEAMRKGADRAFLLSDRKLAGSDTWATAEALSTLINWVSDQDEGRSLDVLFAGLQTIDGDTAHVGPQVAGRLGFNQVTYVEEITPTDNGMLEVRRILEGGFQRLKVPTPVMFSVSHTANTPRGPSLSYSIKSLEKETTIVDIEKIGLPEDKAGLPGSPTVVARVKNVSTVRGETKFYSEGTAEDKIGTLLSDLESVMGKSDGETPEDSEELSEEEKEAIAKQEKRIERDSDLPYVDLRDGARGIGVWAQTEGEKLSDAALELLGEAQRVKHKLDEDSRSITAVIIGPNASKHADKLIAHGADKVMVIEEEKLHDYMTLPYTKAICQAVKEIKPEIFLFSASTLGRDLAPRVAAILDVGLSADCTEFDVGYYSSRKKGHRFGKAFQMRRPSFGESKLATIIGPWTYPQMATARPGTFRALPADDSREGEIVTFTPSFDESDWSIELLESVRNPETIELDKADIVVSGGMGVGSKGFDQLRELVDAMKANGQNAELGASRAAVDAGFMPYKHQVGQTGKTVRPVVYVAVGISGAIQHVQGMKDSNKVIAINSDPNANIWKNADFGIVANYQEILPELVKKVKSGYKFPIEA